MLSLLNSGIRILVSSREISPAAFCAKDVHIYSLDNDILNKAELSDEKFKDLDSVKLFCSIFNREIFSGEFNDFRTLILNLDGHPLSIVLTATQAHSEINIGSLLKHWDKARQDAAMMNKTHTNLEIALQMSWNFICKNNNAIMQWGLEFYSIKEIPEEIFNNLRGTSSENEWNEGLRMLIGSNLVYITKERNAIAMLLPLKKQFSFLNKDPLINEQCLIRWSEYINGILIAANDRKSCNYLSMHYSVIDLIPQIFFIIEQLLTLNSERNNDYLNSMVINMGNYYQFNIQSKNILKKLIYFYENNNDRNLTAITLSNYGDLLSRTGDPDGAREAYDKAEKLYIKEQADLGLANLFLSRGILLIFIGNYSDSERLFEDAERLYLKVNNVIGLTNLRKIRNKVLELFGNAENEQNPL